MRGNKIQSIIQVASLTIGIAVAILIGLSAFMAARRINEIGIRKVLRASVESVFILLSREFLKWVALAILKNSTDQSGRCAEV